MRIAGSSVDADDVVHDVFLVVQRRLHEFRGDAKVTTWLYRITCFVALRQLRAQRAPGAVSAQDDAAEAVASPEPNACERLQAKQEALAVHAVLDSLDEKHRNVLVLFEIDGHNGEEIAEMTSTKVSTVWVRLHRWRERFRERMRALQLDEAALERRSA